MPGFGCCYPISSHLQPYQADGHLHKSLLLFAMRNAEIEESILMEDSITNSILQHISSLLFLLLMRVVNNFHANYSLNQGIKTAGKNLNWALLSKKAPLPWTDNFSESNADSLIFFRSFPTSTSQFAIKICYFRFWYWILSEITQMGENASVWSWNTAATQKGFFRWRKRISFTEKHQ